ncbi:hypothetical protein JCM19296_317 [Nonlabens ulvanivorans]|uniref:Uncharacterized protein n=1 Tax=Nonlabens ulvanivorans TaxID=906888 RepID=A0A081D743_NONUL|nr:FG-GAP repeat protein [Nonlabens ulvanivorans]GAK74739.1 hypothetical protein JCM19296_317 [Nonlabens ulvanivorans]
MKSFIVLLFLCTSCLYAQIGINTNDPKGTLDVTSVNNTGLVLPRVTSVEDVTDGNSNPPLNGTVVFDLSRGTTCFYQNSEWMCITYDTTGNVGLTNVSYIEPPSFNYIKASNTQDNDQFGYSVSLSGNGNTMAVRARGEDSNATGLMAIKMIIAAAQAVPCMYLSEQVPHGFNRLILKLLIQTLVIYLDAL